MSLCAIGTFTVEPHSLSVVETIPLCKWLIPFIAVFKNLNLFGNYDSKFLDGLPQCKGQIDLFNLEEFEKGPIFMIGSYKQEFCSLVDN